MQPEVTPAWICGPVGAGDAKPLPGATRSAFAATSPAGTLARWQLSQVVDDGMCALGPGGDVAGMTTMVVIPAKVDPDTAGPWHVAQPLTMPAWSIWPPEKLANPVRTDAMWHVAHWSGFVLGTWLAGRPVAVLPSWHVAHVLRSAPRLEWSKRRIGENAIVLWHWSHDSVVTMWPAGLPVARTPLWHVAQSPGVAIAWLKRTPLNVTVV